MDFEKTSSFRTGVFTNALTLSDVKSFNLLSLRYLRRMLMLPLTSAFIIRLSFVLYNPLFVRTQLNSGISESPYFGRKSKSTALAFEV